MKISHISDVIYITSKNELKIASAKTKVLDSFPPQKWEVSGYSVFRFTDIQPC